MIKYLLVTLLVVVGGFILWMNVTSGRFLFVCINKDQYIKPEHIIVKYGSNEDRCKNISPIENSKFAEYIFVTVANSLDFNK